VRVYERNQRCWFFRQCTLHGNAVLLHTAYTSFLHLATTRREIVLKVMIFSRRHLASMLASLGLVPVLGTASPLSSPVVLADPDSLKGYVATAAVALAQRIDADLAASTGQPTLVSRRLPLATGIGIHGSVNVSGNGLGLRIIMSGEAGSAIRHFTIDILYGC
jgi:hypothetical protein